ncbi:Fic family protein [Polaribacter atrinae]|uniref:Uncharacterized protein n=1 Tax=Polaribacter atrinae TaxID=1333662 RepID=A0A176TEE2_9FLAO|nr:hypothetical protein [Polaribacter atrinae]OAD45903.1 hypothetical protein LPB303_06345 [Polaribacter atrinae]
MQYFSKTIIEVQQNTLKRVDFIVEKAKFFLQYSTQLNNRQQKVLLRVFEAGYTGFIGGLSSEKYTKIAKTSSSTATTNLKDLVDKGILTKRNFKKYSF